MATGQLTSWALCAAITYIAPVSRAMVPSSNAVISSSAHRTQLPIILNFSSEEGRAAVHQWYEKQGSNTRFTSLEYRKDRNGRFRHEFIVVRLDDTTLCRFDRRAREDQRGHALKSEGTITEDSAHVLGSSETEYEELEEGSELLLSVSFPDGEDLKLILGICFGIQSHPRAASYSLLRYNCYFFSWAIVTAIARRAVKWEDAVTSGIVREAVFKAVKDHSHAHTFLSHAIRDPIRNWFPNLARRYASILSDEQDTEDFWGPLEHHLTSKGHFWDLGPVLQKVLLRSQLAPAMTKEARQFVKATWLSVMSSYAESNIRRQVSSEFRHELSQYTSEGHKDVGELAIKICRMAAETMFKHDDESSKNRLGSFFPPDDNTWDHANNEHRSELLLLQRPAKAEGSGSSSITHEFGEELKKIGDRVSRRIRKNYARLAFEQSIVFAKNVTTTLLENLVDIDPKRVTISNIDCKGPMMYSLEDPPLQELIGCRMRDHFRMVERYGFGRFEELLATAEESLCESWVTSIEVLDRDILSWPIVPPRRQDPGRLVPLWLLEIGLGIMTVLRPILDFALPLVCAIVLVHAAYTSTITALLKGVIALLFLLSPYL